MSNEKALALTPKKDKRFRKQFRFWLDENNPRDHDLLYYCEQQKGLRQFQKTIENALRLYGSLREGRVDWLLDMFPQIENMIALHRYQQRQNGQSE